MNDGIRRVHADFATRAFKRKHKGRPLSERQIIALEKGRVDRDLRQLKEDFYARQETRCSAV